MSDYYVYDGAPCPVPTCDGHLRVRTETKLETEGGLSKLVRKRIEECDRQDCPYYHATLLDEVESVNRLAFEEDGDEGVDRKTAI